ncbi:hypothetical protein DH86_00001382 [Scytalidium sp. 3C]|nr:hypothetical protein DH86_00001382 [Scytalidium sp. 3C]
MKKLFIYPVKSLLPVELSAVELTNEGLRFDRSFVLITPPQEPGDGIAIHLTIKTTFQLCLFQPFIDESWTNLTIKHVLAEPPSSITVPLTPSPLSLLQSQTFHVSIFGTTAVGIDVGEEAARFFTRHLGRHVRLLFIGGSGRREIPGAAYIPGHVNALSLASQEGLQPQRIRFADAAPLLVTSSASEEDARSRYPTECRDEDILLRFRPNLHVNVEGVLPPYDEDNWSILVIKPKSKDSREVTVRCIFKCVRCLSLNADPKTGAMAPEIVLTKLR